MRGLAGVLLIALSGCVSGAQPQAAIPDPDLPANGQAWTGPQAQSVFNWCLAKAMQEQPGFSIRALAYQKGYVQSCMFKFDVPPDYVFVMMRGL